MFSCLRKQTHRSVFAFIFVVALLVPSFTFLVPQKVQAAVPTLETNLAVITGIINTAFNTELLKDKDLLWDTLLYVAKQAVITTMLNSIQTWAESGFDGGPSFVQDPEAFLLEVGDQAA